MPNTPSASTITQTKRKLDALLRTLAKQLEGAAVKSLLAISRKYPNRTITFCSAMGSWGWSSGTVNDWRTYDAERPERLFADTRRHYGWGAIPAPIRIRAKNGKILERLTDW